MESEFPEAPAPEDPKPIYEFPLEFDWERTKKDSSESKPRAKKTDFRDAPGLHTAGAWQKYYLDESTKHAKDAAYLLFDASNGMLRAAEKTSHNALQYLARADADRGGRPEDYSENYPIEWTAIQREALHSAAETSLLIAKNIDQNMKLLRTASHVTEAPKKVKQISDHLQNNFEWLFDTVQSIEDLSLYCTNNCGNPEFDFVLDQLNNRIYYSNMHTMLALQIAEHPRDALPSSNEDRRKTKEMVDALDQMQTRFKDVADSILNMHDEYLMPGLPEGQSEEVEEDEFDPEEKETHALMGVKKRYADDVFGRLDAAELAADTVMQQMDMMLSMLDTPKNAAECKYLQLQAKLANGMLGQAENAARDCMKYLGDPERNFVLSSDELRQFEHINKEIAGINTTRQSIARHLAERSRNHP